MALVKVGAAYEQHHWQLGGANQPKDELACMSDDCDGSSKPNQLVYLSVFCLQVGMLAASAKKNWALA